MDLYEVGKRQIADHDEELKALASRILPLPLGILPSTRFMKQTRELLLSRNDRRLFKAA
jgi:hypothetical protein